MASEVSVRELFTPTQLSMTITHTANFQNGTVCCLDNSASRYKFILGKFLKNLTELLYIGSNHAAGRKIAPRYT